MSLTMQVECNAGKIVDLSQSINEVDVELRSNGHQIAVVCDDGRYIGLLRLEQVAETLKRDPSAGTKNLNSKKSPPI